MPSSLVYVCYVNNFKDNWDIHQQFCNLNFQYSIMTTLCRLMKIRFSYIITGLFWARFKNQSRARFWFLLTIQFHTNNRYNLTNWKMEVTLITLSLLHPFNLTRYFGSSCHEFPYTQVGLATGAVQLPSNKIDWHSLPSLLGLGPYAGSSVRGRRIFYFSAFH